MTPAEPVRPVGRGARAELVAAELVALFVCHPLAGLVCLSFVRDTNKQPGGRGPRAVVRAGPLGV